MNDKKKIEILSKKLIKNSILKYSNKALFERREKKYKSENKEKKKAPKIFKINKYFQKKIEETKENILYPFCKTMTSFYSLDKSSNILPLLDIFENDNSKTKKYKHKSIINKLNQNNKIDIHNYLNNRDKRKTTNYFYITETNKKRNNISYLLNKDKNNNKKGDLNIDTLLLIQTYRNNENNNKLKISMNISEKRKKYPKHYSYIKTELNKNNFDKTIEENDAKRILNCKISKYNHYKQPNFKDFIKKSQELKIYSYTAKIKKERAVRLEEAYYNQIEFYQDTIQSLNSAQKLLDVQFSNKISDYTRFVMSKREREKVKSSKLIQEIMNHRKDIEHIKNKINKIEIEKNNIIKWIYFMIQMKEKKLVLPFYYKIVLEKGKTKRLSRKQITRRDDKKENVNRNKNVKKSFRKSGFFQLENLGQNINDNTNNNNDNKTNEHKISDNNLDNYNIENISYISNAINKKKKEEYEKILNYKNNLIFQTPDEFQDRLSSFEKENITLLTYKDELNHQLFKYKKELVSLIKDENSIVSKSTKIKLKENELYSIKNIVEEKIKIISEFKKTEENLEIEFKKERDKPKNIKYKNIKKENIIENNINNNNNINENKNTMLYRKINNIFEVCKIVGTKLKFSGYILNLVNKKIYRKEKEMILMLEFIEQTVDYLINYINSYNNKNEEINEFIKNVKLDIEKEHKIEKARLQMMIDLQKVKSLKEKVEKRSNKIYFLPSKKIDLSKFKIKKEKQIIDKDLNKTPTIEDYLYNEKDEK